MSIELEVFSTKDLTSDDIVLVYVLINQKATEAAIARYIKQHHMAPICKSLRRREIEYVLIPKYVNFANVKTIKATEVEIAKEAKTYPEFDDSMKALNGE